MLNEAMLADAMGTFVSSNLWKGILIFILVQVAWMTIKRITALINEWIKIHTDNFGIGSTVYHNKKKCIIRHIGFRRIELCDFETGESKYVKTSEWDKFELVVPEHPKNKEL